jgi:hypothetical protein
LTETFREVGVFPVLDVTDSQAAPSVEVATLSADTAVSDTNCGGGTVPFVW